MEKEWIKQAKACSPILYELDERLQREVESTRETIKQLLKHNNLKEARYWQGKKHGLREAQMLIDRLIDACILEELEDIWIKKKI